MVEIVTSVAIQGPDPDESARFDLPVTQVTPGTPGTPGTPETVTGIDWRPVGSTLRNLGGRTEVEDTTSTIAEIVTFSGAGPSDQFLADREARVLQAMALGNPDAFKDEATADRLLLGLASSRQTFGVPEGKVGETKVDGVHYQVRETLQPDGSYRFTLVEVAPPKAPPQVEPSLASTRRQEMAENGEFLTRDDIVVNGYDGPASSTGGAAPKLPFVGKDPTGHWKPASGLPPAHAQRAYFLAAYNHAKEDMGLGDDAARVFARDIVANNPDPSTGLTGLHGLVDSYKLPDTSTGPDASRRAHAHQEMARYASAEAYAKSRAQGSGHEDDVADKLGRVASDARWAVAMGPDGDSPKNYWEAVFADSGESLIARDELPASFKDKRKDEILAAISPRVDEIDRDLVDAQTRLVQGREELSPYLATRPPVPVPAPPATTVTPDATRDYKTAMTSWEAGRAVIEGRIAKADGDLRSAAESRVAYRNQLLSALSTGDRDALRDLTGGETNTFSSNVPGRFELTDDEAKKLAHQYEMATEGEKGSTGDKWLARSATALGALAGVATAGANVKGALNDPAAASNQQGADQKFGQLAARSDKAAEIAANKSAQHRLKGQEQMNAAAAKIGQKKGSHGEALDSAVAGLATGATKGKTGDTMTASGSGPRAPGQSPEEIAAAKARAKAEKRKAEREQERMDTREV